MTFSNILKIVKSEKLKNSGLLQNKIVKLVGKKTYQFHNFLAKKTNYYWKPFKNETGNSYIHPSVYIADKGVKIGNNCIIQQNVVIHENTIIDDDVIIGPGVVIGSEGFEYRRFDNEILLVIHTGGIHIHRGVEINSYCCIDKAIFEGFTEIGEYSFLDTLIHVAHNVKIGKRCMVSSSSMIGGHTHIEDDVWVGTNVSISDGLSIGHNAFIESGSVVTKNVSENEQLFGNFAIDSKKFISFMKSINEGKFVE